MRMTVHSFDFIGVVKGFNGTPDQKLNPQESMQAPCGSEPARDSGVSANINVGCTAVIASKLAPTGVM